MKTCIKCGSKDKIQVHHLMPKRFFRGDKQAMKKTIELCEGCHISVESILTLAERDQDGVRKQLRPWIYLALNQVFLTESFLTAYEYAQTISKSHARPITHSDCRKAG